MSPPDFSSHSHSSSRRGLLKAQVEGVLDLLLKPFRHIAEFGHVPGLTQLPDDRSRLESRLLGDLANDRVLGGLPIVNAARRTWVPDAGLSM